MNTIENLKLAIFEASKEKLIDKSLTDKMVSFCESADLSNSEDVAVLESMCDTLIAVSESVNKNEKPDIDANAKQIKLSIFESEASGEITAEERDTLLAMM